MANQKLLEVFLDTKRILCRYDYYIHIPKLITKYYHDENKQASLFAMVNGKIDNHADYDLHYR